jgi:alpha/beta superfamily hydrolase
MRIPAEVKPAVWGAIAGAAALAIVGFSWGGWVTGSTAQALAKAQSDRAVVMALAPICVENFRHHANAEANLAELQKASSWEQATYIEKGGWAKMPGGGLSTGVAAACAEILRKPAA